VTNIKQKFMSAKDVFHDAVKNALMKEGWIITHDPLIVQFGGFDLYIDLGAESVLAAEKAGKKIAVEIKSFLKPSFISEFHATLGQFINYKLALEEEQPERILYLAIPDEIYQAYFHRPLTQKVVERMEMKLCVYDIEKESILQWLT